MNNFAKFLFIISFFVSALYLPWWVTVGFAVILLAVWKAYVSVFVGGVVMDIVFGGPLSALADFSYLYTSIFFVLIAASYALNRMMLE